MENDKEKQLVGDICTHLFQELRINDLVLAGTVHLYKKVSSGGAEPMIEKKLCDE